MLDVHFYNYFPVTWMQQQHHQLNSKSLPSATPDPLLPRLTASHLKHGRSLETWRKRNHYHHHHCLSSSPTWLKTLHSSSCVLFLWGRKKHSDFLISELFFLSIFVFFFSSCWGILSDSSRTGILDALHSRRSFFLWDVALCEKSLFRLSSGSHSFLQRPPQREEIGYFILSCNILDASHTLTDFKIHSRV